MCVCVLLEERVSHLVVPVGGAAAHTLLHAVVQPLTAGLGHQRPGVEEPEEALLEVLGPADATAVELAGETQRGGGMGQRTAGNTGWNGWLGGGREEEAAKAHRGHDGVPGGCEDVGVVVALVVAFQLPAEVLSGQLFRDTDRKRDRKSPGVGGVTYALSHPLHFACTVFKTPIKHPCVQLKSEPIPREHPFETVSPAV